MTRDAELRKEIEALLGDWNREALVMVDKIMDVVIPHLAEDLVLPEGARLMTMGDFAKLAEKRKSELDAMNVTMVKIADIVWDWQGGGPV